jgi:hypothetical protein
MSILSDIGTKVGNSIKNLASRVQVLEDTQPISDYITFQNNITLADSESTSALVTELLNLGCFQNNAKSFKVAWSYANNSDLTDTGFGTVELAGCLIETWGGRYKNIRITRPTTGEGGEIILFYTDQGEGYSPGWRQILTG